MTPEQRKELQDEFSQLIKAGWKSQEDLKYAEERGAEILTKLVDDEILTKLFSLADKKKENDKMRREFINSRKRRRKK